MRHVFMGIIYLAGAFLLSVGWNGGGEPDRMDDLRAAMDKLRPLHRKLGKPRPGEWLAIHPEEGQSFRQYMSSRPITPDERRRFIYIQPLGDFTETQRRIVDLTAEFMGIYFDLTVKVSEDLPLSIIPGRARRVHPDWGMKQIRTTFVLDRVLRPRLRRDALACIAFTTSDLWPGEGWNFVFGQASLRRRVGVWSIYRNGDPEGSEAGFRLCLLRTLKTACHEMGHMISMLHCIRYECNMCGSNNREESDRRPIALCPECLGKICWATGADPLKRYEKLAAFCKQHGLAEEQVFFIRSIETLEGEKPGTGKGRDTKN